MPAQNDSTGTPELPADAPEQAPLGGRTGAEAHDRVEAGGGDRPGPAEKPRGWKRWWKLILLGVLVVVVTVVVKQTDLEQVVTYENIQDHLDTLRGWAHEPYGPPLFILLAWAFILLHMPELVIIVAGGMLYDFWAALIYSWIGCNAGISTAFLIARFFLRDYFRPMLDNSFLAKYDKKLEQNGLTIIIVLRLALFLFPPLTWLIGASGIKTRDYLVGSCIGVTPWLVAILMTLSTVREAESMMDLLNARTLAVVGAFGVVIGVVLWVRKRFFPGAHA